MHIVSYPCGNFAAPDSFLSCPARDERAVELWPAGLWPTGESAMKIFILAITPALLLGACQGPKAQAGAEKDKAAAVAAGQSYDGDGPNERIGAARDRAADAAEDAREAEAEAIEKERDSIRSAADIEAERLEQEAKAVRKAADERADAVEGGSGR
jgi:hypothetical protein